MISISASKSGSQGRTGLMDKILCGHFVDSSIVIELAESKSVFKSCCLTETRQSHLDQWVWLTSNGNCIQD